MSGKFYKAISFTLLAATLVLQIHCQTILVADFQMKGLKTKITLTQTDLQTDTTVEYHGGNIGTYNWEFHEFRVFYAEKDRCGTKSIGVKFMDFTADSTTTEIPLNVVPDLRQLTGRSILLNHLTEGESICATVEEEAEYVTVMAKFLSTVAGTVTFRQKADAPNTITTIYSDLYFVDGPTDQSSMKWQVYSGAVTADIDETKPLSQRCESIGSLYNPTVGDLSGKHGNLSIGLEQNDKKMFFSDLQLPLSKSFSIADRSLVIINSDDEIIACANILGFPERQATAFFSRSGLKGHIQFTQKTVFDATKVEINFPYLNQSASKYGIHEWPVPQKFHADQDICALSEISGPWNPFKIENLPASGEGTNDQYAIGDLSGKFGELGSEKSIDAVYHDWNLPLFGPVSIAGRSVAMLHKNGDEWSCANINLHTPMVTAIATFKYPVIGHIMLRQPENDWSHDTQIYIELNYGTGTQATNDHRWGIHENKTTKNDFDAEGSNRCKSTGHLYQPYAFNVTDDYYTKCSANQLHCMLGALAPKHGKISVRSPEGGSARAFFTDINLPLTGPHSVVGRSMIVGKSNAHGPLACADIVKLPERHVTVTEWAANQPSEISGVVDINSRYPGFLSGATDLNLSLDNLKGEASGFHVHNYPVLQKENPCDATSVGGHFMPFGIDVHKSPPAGEGTDDQYEVGDLSGKYGNPLDNEDSVSIQHILDTNLPLRGPYSIVGKSLLIHKNDETASRWVCGNITEDTEMMKSHRYIARANFEGELEGYIEMNQYMYNDFSLSDTEVIVDIKYKNGSKSENHNWYVHINPVGEDSESGCVSAGGHYNPFHVETTHGYDECKLSNPLRCAVGDQSGKLGSYDIGSGRRFFTDVNLPLNGPFSVIGRSFGINGENHGDSILACADIIPRHSSEVKMHIFLSGAVNKSDMVYTVAKATNAHHWDLAVETDMKETSECKLVIMHFTGPHRDELKHHLKDVMENDKKALGKYAPTSIVCGSAGGLSWSLLTILLSVCVSWVLGCTRS